MVAAMSATMLEDASEASEVAAQPKGMPRMSLALLNFWVDAGLFVLIIFVMWTSVLLHVIFPPGTAAAGWKLWGLNYDQWRNVQFGALCAFALLAIEHLVLHWNWVISIIATKVLRTKNRPDEGLQVVIGVGTFITVLLTMMVSLLTALFSVQKPL
jgi:hypothetical protein